MHRPEAPPLVLPSPYNLHLRGSSFWANVPSEMNEQACRANARSRGSTQLRKVFNFSVSVILAAKSCPRNHRQDFPVFLGLVLFSIVFAPVVSHHGLKL